MQIEMTGLSFSLTPPIVRHVKQRVGTALATFATAPVRSVMTTLRDINGPRGGVDKGCRIVVWLHGRKAITADAVERDLYAAVDAAAAKLKESMRRLLRRGQTLRRGRTLRRGQRIRLLRRSVI
jgi:putative sigma-54 modulation protein